MQSDCRLWSQNLPIDEATDGLLCIELFASTPEFHAKHSLNTMSKHYLKVKSWLQSSIPWNQLLQLH